MCIFGRSRCGDFNSRVLSLLDAPAIIWSIDPVDWRDRNAYTVRDRIVARAFDGAIILCHDIYSSTVDGVLMAIDILQEQGYEFVTVNELYRRRGVSLNNGETYYSCKPTGTQLDAVKAPVISTEIVNGNADTKTVGQIKDGVTGVFAQGAASPVMG